MMKYANPANRAAYNHSVWLMVRQIPAGKVSTYGHIARLIPPPPGISPDDYHAWGARWVGGAMAACPEDVPWWRVINSQGKISLRESEGSFQQRDRLEGEGIVFDERERIDLKKYLWAGPGESAVYQPGFDLDLPAGGGK